MKTLNCDVLVIGSGLAGLMTAYHLRGRGSIIVASKRAIEESNTHYAQGGIACVMDPDDSFEAHERDTLSTGCGLCDESVVRTIIRAGPECVRELEALGISFERRRGRSREYDLGQEGGHSRRRVLHAGDVTGRQLIRVLARRVAEAPSVTMLPDWMAIDLVTTSWLRRPGPNRCIGAYFIERATGDIHAIRARHTVLATGGAGKVYLYTSNPDTATGDGIAMGWRCGLPIRNMEFVQFHPTCLYHPEAKSFLISETVRGEGARLINAAGESFMERYDSRGALAPRDIVARAIDQEMKRRGDPCVYLDITHRGEDFLKTRFPTIYATCLKYGFDMARQPIPVVPAAHYFVGGIMASVDGRTEIEGLYAVGETASTGLHGANRLASNSLLEALVCSRLCARTISEAGRPRVEDVEIPPWEIGAAVPSDEAVVVEHNWNEVRTVMWDYVGIVRTIKRLERAARRIRNLRHEIRQYYLSYLVTPDVLELRNIAAVADLVIRSAFARRESRGLHFTLNFPEMAMDAPPRDTIIRDPPGGPIAEG